MAWFQNQVNWLIISASDSTLLPSRETKQSASTLTISCTHNHYTHKSMQCTHTMSQTLKFNQTLLILGTNTFSSPPDLFNNLMSTVTNESLNLSVLHTTLSLYLRQLVRHHHNHHGAQSERLFIASNCFNSHVCITCK